MVTGAEVRSEVPVNPRAEQAAIDTAANLWAESLVQVAAAKARYEETTSAANSASCALQNAKAAEAKAWERLDSLRKGAR